MNSKLRKVLELFFLFLAGSLLAMAVPVFADQTSQPAAVLPSNSGTSRNWAGYVANGGGFTSVSGSWTVPQPAASSGATADATWIGIGGFSSPDLIQAGTQAVAGPGGNFTYQAWLEVLPSDSQPVSMAVDPGDSITASITQQQNGQWLISIHNNTNGQSYQDTITYSSSLSSAEWIEEMPSSGRNFIPLDNFGTVQFTGGQAVQNGQTLSVVQSGAQIITMTNGGKKALATVSALDAAGANFSISRTSIAPDTSVRFVSARKRTPRADARGSGYLPVSFSKAGFPGFGTSTGKINGSLGMFRFGRTR